MHIATMTKAHWQRHDEADLTRGNIEKLISNQIPVIRIKSFATQEECRNLLAAIEEFGFQLSEETDPLIGQIGITQYEFKDHEIEGKNPYFHIARSADAIRNQISKMSFDFLQRVIQQIQSVWPNPVEIAHEKPESGKYFAGLIRQINRSEMIHSDFACFDAPDWKIGRIISQLTWNLYVKPSDFGGECTIYNKQWKVTDERYRIKDSYGYDPQLVDGTETTVIPPRVGDLILFNSRNFHEVKTTQGDRITVSSFVGQMESGKLVLWS